MTAKVTPIFRPVNMLGRANGKRIFLRIVNPCARVERARSSISVGTERIPAAVLTTIGKKAIRNGSSVLH
jgi:hypothetical protein